MGISNEEREALGMLTNNIVSISIRHDKVAVLHNAVLGCVVKYNQPNLSQDNRECWREVILESVNEYNAMVLRHSIVDYKPVAIDFSDLMASLIWRD